MDVFCLSTFSFFFHFIAYGLRLSGIGFDGFFLFFNLQLLFPFYCLWFKAVGYKLWCIYLVFYLAASFFHFIEYGLRLSCLRFEGFFGFLPFSFFFHFIAYGFQPSGLGFDGFFFCFSTCRFFFHFIPYGLRLSGIGFDGFFSFFTFQLLFPFYCLWFTAVGFRLWWIFCFVFQLAASFSFLLPMV